MAEGARLTENIRRTNTELQQAKALCEKSQAELDSMNQLLFDFVRETSAKFGRIEGNIYARCCELETVCGENTRLKFAIGKKEDQLRKLDDQWDANARLSLQMKQATLQMQDRIDILWKGRSKMLKKKSVENEFTGSETTRLNGYAKEVFARIRPVTSDLESELKNLRVQMEPDKMQFSL
ncbi:unnamed protein product [Schistocephalus solidus]|uniref:Uncharacterized protein n=1 Tax=Schistocephalus solidus TaxID=70667 RepID=A0A183TFD6_SCHSO|nr:unnamed protein product [Schistocephalus solidus]